jgi:hypothetical protein
MIVTLNRTNTVNNFDIICVSLIFTPYFFKKIQLPYDLSQKSIELLLVVVTAKVWHVSRRSIIERVIALLKIAAEIWN